MGWSALFHADTASDYNEAYSWYELQQGGLGERFLNAVEDVVQKIIVSPEVFGTKSKHGYREAIVRNFPYSVVYRLNKDTRIILITSIHHHKKHPRGKFRK